MKKISKLFLFGFVAVCLVVVLIVGISRGGKKNVRIAFNIPMSGPVAVITGCYPEAFKMGVEDESRKLEVPIDSFLFDIQDNQAKTEVAVSACQKQMINGIDMMASGSSSQSSALIPMVAPLKVPHFLVSFDAFMAEMDSNVVRILPHFKIEAPLYVQYAVRRKAKKIFAINMNISAYEEQYSRLITPALKDNGISIQRESIPADFNDFRTLASKVAMANADLIFISTYSFQIQPILEAMNERSLIKEGNVFATLDFLDLLPNKERYYDLYKSIAFACPVFELENCSKSAKEWKDVWKTKFHTRPTYIGAYAYVTGQSVVRAYVKEEKITVNSIVRNFPEDSIVGAIKVDANNDLASTLVIGRIGDGGGVLEIR